MAIIGVDWGSSSFRAYRYNENGAVAKQIHHNSGILRVKNGDFAETLFALLASVLQQGDKILLSGMITSRNGWIETPYAELPLNLESYLSLAQPRVYNNTQLLFLPGVCQHHPPDVMRGEELQIFGVCAAVNDAIVILPGTHSKWVDVRNGDIVSFQTIMTGEVYDLLMNNSLIGLVADGTDFIENIFIKGVKDGASWNPERGTLLTKVFSARAGVLLDRLSSEEVSSFLSGLLIGSEVASGLLRTENNISRQLMIVGNQTLTDRYAMAFKILGRGDCKISSSAAARGYSRIVCEQGLIP